MRYWKKIVIVVCCLLTAQMSKGQLNTDRITAIGRNALYFEDYVLSIQYFNQVIRLKPYLSEPYLYRAIAKIQLGDYAGAEKDCTSAIVNNPFLPGAYYTRGFVRMQLHHWQQAEEDFTEALVFAPENRTYIILRAETRSQQENFAGAQEDISFLLKKEPQNANFLFEKGVICMTAKDTLCARDAFRQATDYDSQNPSNWSALGLVNMLLEDESEAMLALTKAINLGSRWAGDYINRGILQYRKHNYRGALSDYDKAVDMNKNDAQCYYNRGMLRAELGDYNHALEDFDKAIELSPDKTEMRYQRGVVLLQLKQWQAAIDDFDELIARYPYFLPSYYLAAQAKTALNDARAAYLYQQKAHELEQNKEAIQRQLQQVNTDVQIAASQPQKRDRRKEFSHNAAQNRQETEDDTRYQSETRGAVQKRYADVVNEPNIMLSYYQQTPSLRRTHYFHYLVDDYNKQYALPSPLHFTLQESPLTAELVNHHFEAIDRISTQIDRLEELQAAGKKEKGEGADLYFARAIEFALVQDYSSAIDDCTKAIISRPEFTIAFFCRANWRYKLLEYMRSTGELYDENYDGKLDFEMILRDYDQVIRLQPDFSFAYYNKANILCTQKSFKDAILYYSEAIEHDADFAEAWFNRALTRIYIDETDAGMNDLSKAGELGIYQAYNLITRFQ